MQSVLKKIYIFIICLVVGYANGQESLRIGDWSSYLPLNRGVHVTQTPENIVYVSEQSLLLIDKQTRSHQVLSKTDGLNDVGYKFVKYYKPTKTLAVVYENSNIDLIIDGRIRNFNQIRNNLNIVGDKNIFDVSFDDNGSLFLSCGFGLVQLNLVEGEFGVTTFTPVAVNDFASIGDYYFMATQEGLYRANFRTSSNLADFGQWEYLDEEYGLPSGLRTQELAIWEDKLYLGLGNMLYVSNDGNQFDLVTTRPGYSILYLSGETDNLSIGWDCSGCQNEVQFLSTDGTFSSANTACISNPRFAVQDQYGTIWLADLNSGIRILNERSPNNCEFLEISSIYSANVSDIELREEKIYIASGGVLPNTNFRFREDGFFEFDGTEWRAFNKFNVPEFGARDIRDFLKVKLHPTEDTLFIATYYDGLIKWTSESEFVIYDEFNSTLMRGLGDPNRIRIAGLDWDSKGNLWVGHFDGPRPISVYKNDGTWKSFSVSGSNSLMDLVVDQFDNKWIRVYNGGLLVFNEGNDMDDESDYRFRSITTSNSILPSNGVTCLTEDLDGGIWIGTENGIALIACGSDPFNPACRGSESFLEQDGFGAILLDGQNITAIAIDGGNRKWIGTTAGLFVQSPTGDEPIYNFTSNNSPLMDDNITAIRVDDETGLVYIGTNRGLQVFKAEATGGTGSFKSAVYAYPNPVRPDYDGPIAIKGLARDANVKITDTDGRLVYEGRATGGQAIWDGRDLSGRRIVTGVYLVFATSTRNLEFPQTEVTKLLFVR